MNYLELYYEWVEKGRIEDNPCTEKRRGNGGLCNTVITSNKESRDLLYRFDYKDAVLHHRLKCNIYWASDFGNINPMYDFGPTRQNIVLFMAAIKGQIK